MTARVNRDASLSVAAPASGPSGRHASDGHDGLLDNAVRPAGSSVAEPAGNRRQRSKSDRGRSNCKRSPGGGNLRTGKDGPISARPALCRRRGVDERHRWQDSRPACVPGTVWGTAPMQNLQVARGAVLAPKLWQALAAPSSWCPPPSMPARASAGRSAPALPHLTRHQDCSAPPGASRRAMLAAVYPRIFTAADSNL